MRNTTHYFNLATATAIAAARLIPLPLAQSSSRSSTAGSIDTVMASFFPARLRDFLPSGAWSMKSSMSACRGDTSGFRNFAIGSPSSFRWFATDFTDRPTEHCRSEAPVFVSSLLVPTRIFEDRTPQGREHRDRLTTNYRRIDIAHTGWQ